MDKYNWFLYVLDKYKLISSATMESDYLGWVFFDVDTEVLNTYRTKPNHGFLITVQDSKNASWHAPSVFDVMDCVKGASKSKRKVV